MLSLALVILLSASVYCSEKFTCQSGYDKIESLVKNWFDERPEASPGELQRWIYDLEPQLAGDVNMDDLIDAIHIIELTRRLFKQSYVEDCEYNRVVKARVSAFKSRQVHPLY